jgi:hypothetical protein
MIADIASDPRQPNRLEKKKNTSGWPTFLRPVERSALAALLRAGPSET